ncbi:SRPBCC family protein [Nocardioides antri]|uniref:SRPBCC family protein n=1 Tax=Nocardioides antri TaxID=2607659 RepID=UPI001CB72BA0|nr:SRPBCC family protein [Nocardioides antri]
MPDMHPCQLVDAGFVDAARHRYSNSVDLAITPEQLFEVLEDADAWPRWAKVITKVTWTSPPPRGVGTTRVVDMRGGLVGDEEFLLWEPPTRMAFRFNASSEKTVQAFAESTTSSGPPRAAGSPGPSRSTSQGRRDGWCRWGSR